MQLVISHNIPIAVGKSRLYQEGITLAHKNQKKKDVFDQRISPIVGFQSIYIYIYTEHNGHYNDKHTCTNHHFPRHQFEMLMGQKPGTS